MKKLISKLLLICFLYSGVMATVVEGYWYFSAMELEVLYAFSTTHADIDLEEDQQVDTEGEESDGEEKESVDADEKEYYNHFYAINYFRNSLINFQAYYPAIDYSVALNIAAQPPKAR